MFKFYVEGRLPTLNEYIRAARGNKYASAKMKSQAEDIIIQYIRLNSEGSLTLPCYITFTWYESSKRRDKDNVCFAKKFILDAMQKCGVLENDGNKYICGFNDEFIYGKRQGVAVEVEGAEYEQGNVNGPISKRP